MKFKLLSMLLFSLLSFGVFANNIITKPTNVGTEIVLDENQDTIQEGVVVLFIDTTIQVETQKISALTAQNSICDGLLYLDQLTSRTCNETEVVLTFYTSYWRDCAKTIINLNLELNTYLKVDGTVVIRS